MAILKLSWLGPPSIEYNGRVIRLEMRKALALLAYLSLSPQNPTRETLASLFWLEHDQQHALSSLRRNLSSLARSLPPGLIEADREKIGLRKEDWLQVDVKEFRDQLAFAREHSHPPNRICPECLSLLERAAAIYKGDFFEGFNLKDCPEFDEWQLFQRESLRSEYAGALEKLAAYYQDQCEWERAIGYNRSWLALDPLNEHAQRMLIGLYNQSGQRRKALGQYENLVHLLEEELGQAPEAETTDLYKHIQVKVTEKLIQEHWTEPLIKTKLFIPTLRVDRVPRPRLLDLLDAGAKRSLTLISAPAGFGKTTLLAAWAVHTQLPIAWISIDQGDNDPIRFTTYLLAALDSILPGVSEQFQAFSQSLQPSIQGTLIRLINRLATESEPFVLILDDYQFIHSLEVHKALAFLLEKIPACMHLVIATRTDPPLSLARLRARDQIVEVRATDLRFSLDESTGFLQQVMSLHLSDEDIAALEARTEGWIAGLQMAALAIRSLASHLMTNGLRPEESGQGVSRFIQAFSGSHRYILDYLREEVLNHLPGEIRSFLLQTSILERFSAPLCDAITGTVGSQAILENLEKENLFLVPLDNERGWYRYHHLFVELLRYQLNETLSKGLEDERLELPSPEEIHLRAARWLETNKLHGEAVQHYIAAREYERAVASVENQVHTMLFITGQAFTLQGWLASLPPDLLRFRPRLNIAKAWTMILQNQFAAALEPLEAAWQAVKDKECAEADSVLGEISLVRGALAELSTRDVEAMRTQGLLAWERLPPEDSMLRGLAAWLLGASYLYDGDILPAESYFSLAIQLCREAGNTFFTLVAVVDLSNVLREQGRYREAYHLLLRTQQEMSSGDQYLHPSLIYICNGLSQILLSWNEVEEAERQLRLGIDLAGPDIPDEILIFGISMLPFIKLAQGKREEAVRLAEDCHRQAEAYPLPYVPTIIKANLIRFWMRVGEQDRIEEWLRNCGLSPGDIIRYLHEAEYAALAKILIWQGRTEEALKILAQLHDLAQSQGRNGKLFYVRALQAMAFKQSGDLENALRELECSLRLAQSEGIIRPYVDEGKSMEELLQLGAARGIWRRSYLDGYVNRLLKAIRIDREQLEGFVGL